MASPPQIKKSVLLLRQTFEGGDAKPSKFTRGDAKPSKFTRGDAKPSKFTRRASHDQFYTRTDSAAGETRCRPGGFGAAKAGPGRGRLTGAVTPKQGLWRSPASSVGQEKPKLHPSMPSGLTAVKNLNSAVQLKKVTPSHPIPSIQVKNKETGIKPGFVENAKGLKPNMPSKPKGLTVIKRAQSEEKVVGTKSLKNRFEKKYAVIDSDPHIGASQDDELKPQNVADRARLFSADEPRGGNPYQRRQTPAEAGARAGEQWDDSGHQGDDEGDFSDRTKPKRDVVPPKLLVMRDADPKQDTNNIPSNSGIMRTISENDSDSGSEQSYDLFTGSDSESAAALERRVIPLRQNKLLQDDAGIVLSGMRRTSSLEELPTVTVAFTNARGLFQLAQQINTHETSDTDAKPPIAQKPTLLKKPPSNDASGSGSNKPATAPKFTPRTPPITAKYMPKLSEQPTPDNIYDEVYRDQEAASIDIDRPTSKKLEKILGPDYVAGDQAGAVVIADKCKKTPKCKQPADTKVRKISTPFQPTMDHKEGPYAVIPLPDAEKTATKKTKNPAEQKTRQISDGNGNKVTLRNSGGMSSGDSGIIGLHTETLEDKRSVRRRDRRMSRRLINQKMKSIDSDFIEDSDDEPIGADSDFDSDTSMEEPAVFMDDSHKKAFEVLTTERTYVDTLYLIDQIFLSRIQAENQKQHWFPLAVLNEIFSNISSLYQLHSAVLLPDLEKALKDWERNPSLGDVLKRGAPFLKLYSDYVSNFDQAMKQLNLWTSKVPKFAAALAEMQNHQLCGNLALQHHMLTPIQRIPRYELLLKEYIRKLPSDSKDKADADKALIMISGAAQHSNDTMKSMEQFEKLLKLNEKIDGENIIDPSRHLLKEGKITKIAAKNKEAQDRYVFLFNDILLCCEKKRLLTSANYKVKVKMDVDGMKVSVLDSEGCRFIIESKTNKSIEFQTNSEEEREEWMKLLLSAIREKVLKKETFKTNDAVADRPNGVSFDKFIPGKNDPVWIRDDETSMCMRCGTDFKLTKRRHHCRSCGSVVCHKCSSYEAPLEYDDNKMNKVCFKCYYTLKGDMAELERLTRRSLIPEINEDKSFASFLYLHHKGAWTKFWVVVTEQDMFVLKAPKDVRPVLTLPIKKYSIRDLNDSDLERDHVFRLSDNRTVHTLSAESKELKKRWMAVLTQGVQEFVKMQTL